jgi:apolipoprotein N-acyltransferase
VVNEYINTIYGGGVWWSVANTQYQLGWLAQLASVTGIWGISFLLYWTASVLVWVFDRRTKGAWEIGLSIYGAVMAVVVLAGCVRYAGGGSRAQTVKVAGVTVPLVELYETLYSDYTGRRIVVNPRASVSDPVMKLVGQAEASYVEAADTARFRHASAVIRAVNDSLFALSQQAADRGARIISWSEGNGIGWKAQETVLVERGRRFAAENKVYLLMTLCLVHPGKITAGKKFLENEAILLGPDGKVLTIFHKNNPVPMVEASQPGDGVIPVLPTSVGRLAVSICYDADQPHQMQQLGQKNADLLLLPSGDWFAISDFHAHMAVYRGIENGCSVFREVSNGLSVATDYRGKVIGSRDWFRDGRSLWLADLPVGHVNTIYSRIGDVLPYGCLLYVLLTFVVLLVLRSRRRAGPFVTDRMALQP